MWTGKIKKVIVLMIAIIMMLTQFVVLTIADESKGEHKMIDVFVSGDSANYRIPNALVTNSGAIWFFCNDRRDSLADYTEIQQICAVCAPDGENFGEVQYLLAEEGWCYVIGAPVYDAVNDKILLLYALSPKSDEAKAAFKRLPAAEQKNSWYVLESVDGGKTWSSHWAGIPISSCALIPSTHGSDTGIQLKYGEHAGRLVIAAHCCAYDTTDLVINSGSSAGIVYLIYSDDAGETWQISRNGTNPGATEPALCELPDGTIYVNGRELSGDNTRLVAYSYDGGETISDCKKEYGLFQVASNGVKGSVISFENPTDPEQHIILYSCLLSPTETRRNLSIWISYDNGETWPEILTIRQGFAAYSSLYYNPITQKIGILYEYGYSHPYDRGIAVEQFDLTWLIENKRLYVPLRTNQTPESVAAELVKTDLQARYLPESLGGIADGASVKTWNDSTGNGNDAVSVKGSESPVVCENGLNGYSVLEFDSNTSMNLPALKDLTGNFTIFLVFKLDKAYPAKNTVILDNTGPYRFRFFAEAPVSYGTHAYCTSAEVGSYAEKIHSITPYDSQYHIVALVWNGHTGEGMLTQFVDGSVKDVKYSSGIYVERKSDSLAIGEFLMGANSFNGKIAELLVYDRALSDEEIAKNGLFLADRYDLSWEGVTDNGLGEKSEPSITTTEEFPKAEGQGCKSTISVPFEVAALSVSVAVISKKRRKWKKK